VRVGYRVRQFWYALTAIPNEKDLAQARQVLSPPLWELFLRLQPGEQAHSLWIFQQLVQHGETSQDVWVAALLHDLGKTCQPLGLWERVMVVLGKAFFPRQARQWGEAEPSGWKRAFVIAAQHAAWGASLASQAGAPDLAVRLIRAHHEPPGKNLTEAEQSWLHILQSLDEETEVEK
jgi:hypothetical protein